MTTVTKPIGKPMLRTAARPDGTVPVEITTVAHQALIRLLVNQEMPADQHDERDRHTLGANLMARSAPELAEMWRQSNPDRPVVEYRLGAINSAADRTIRQELRERGVDGLMIFTQTLGPRIALYNDAGIETAGRAMAERDHPRNGRDDGMPRDAMPEDYIDPWM